MRIDMVGLADNYHADGGYPVSQPRAKGSSLVSRLLAGGGRAARRRLEPV